MNNNFRFGDKILAAKTESSKRQTQLLERGVSRGLVTSGAILRKPFSSKSGPTQNKPLYNNFHPSSFANSRYSHRNHESDKRAAFKNFGAGSAIPVDGGQLPANHPMLDRSSKGPYYPNSNIKKILK